MSTDFLYLDKVTLRIGVENNFLLVEIITWMYWYREANSGCQLAAFWVTGSTNPLGFGSVAPKSSKEIAVITGSSKR